MAIIDRAHQSAVTPRRVVQPVGEPGHSSPRHRVLLLAYACSPYKGSEPYLGWQRAVHCAEHFDTWVICEQRAFEADIQRYFREHAAIPNLHFCFVPRLPFHPGAPYERNIRCLSLFYVMYNLWHRRASRLAASLHRQQPFDLVHQVNITGFREPGYLWKLKIPFIWGPIGGTQNYPWRFLRYARWQDALKEGTRAILNIVQLRFSSRVRKAAQRAAVVLAANSTGQSDFQRVHGVRPQLLLETGIVAVSPEPPPVRKADQPLRLLWVGAFEPRKALHLLLHALARLPRHVEYELRIIGDGSSQQNWQTLAKSLHIEKSCRWMGWIPFEDMREEYRSADAFVFTSLRDTSGNVMLEALATGVPVVCFDHQGAGDIVDATCGIKIRPTDPEEVIAALAQAIARLSLDPLYLQELRYGALDRARQFLWSQNTEQLMDVYRSVLAERAAGGGDADVSSDRFADDRKIREIETACLG